MSDTKYGQHIVPIPVVPMSCNGNGTEGWDLWSKDLGNFEVNIAMRPFDEVGRMNPEQQQKPHAHGFDEVLLFVSYDINDVSNLGLKAEMRMGTEEGMHIVDKPTAVRVPKGLPHCPITFLEMERPYYFIYVAFSATRP